MRVLIVGPGGCAMTSLMHHIRSHNGLTSNEPNNSDWLKHRSKPPDNIAEYWDVCLYLYGKMDACVASLFRRNYVVPQMWQSNLGNPFNIDTSCSIQKYISMVIESGHDLMGIERQFDNWYSYKGPVKVHFIDTSEIGTKQFDEKLRRYLKYYNLRPTELKSRESEISQFPKEFVDIYDKLYQKIKEKGALREPSVRYLPGIRGRLARAAQSRQ